jgi:hypothetical protein
MSHVSFFLAPRLFPGTKKYRHRHPDDWSI